MDRLVDHNVVKLDTNGQYEMGDEEYPDQEWVLELFQESLDSTEYYHVFPVVEDQQ